MAEDDSGRVTVVSDIFKNMMAEEKLEDRYSFGGGDRVLDEGLFIGAVEAGQSKTFLAREGITHVIDLSDWPYQRSKDITYLTISINDSPIAQINKYFDKTNKFIDQAFEAKGKVLVHCAAGISRSATIVLAYLIYKNRMPLDDAFTLLKAARPIVDPNPGFWKQLKEYEKHTLPEAKPAGKKKAALT